MRHPRRTLFLPLPGCSVVRLPLLLVAMGLLLPIAHAQLPTQLEPTLIVSAADPGGAGLPIGARTDIAVSVNYNPPQGGRPTPAPTVDRPEGTAPTRVTLSMKATPSWVENVTFEPEVLLFYVGTENVTASCCRASAIARVNVSAAAPAQQREPFVVLATAEPNGNIGPGTAESAELMLYTRVVGIANVTGPESVVLPGGRWSTLDFTVRNDGNAPIVMLLNVTVRPENSQVNFPDRVQLNAGEAQTVTVEVRTPWTNAEFGTLELEATPVVDGEAATPARATVDVVGESAVPALSIVLVLAAAAIALVAGRR